MAIDQLMFGCQPCAIGYHNECLRPEQLESGDFNCCCVSLLSYGKTADDEDEDGEGRVNDNLTTGRKRAGRLNPILPGMTCEWAGLRYAGGGIVPIVGCSGNTIAKVKSNKDLPEGVDARGALHHGPDKTTMNNAPGLNLHRICEICHHRWHALNDRYYPPIGPAHSPRGSLSTESGASGLTTRSSWLHSRNDWSQRSGGRHVLRSDPNTRSAA